MGDGGVVRLLIMQAPHQLQIRLPVDQGPQLLLPKKLPELVGDARVYLEVLGDLSRHTLLHLPQLLLPHPLHLLIQLVPVLLDLLEDFVELFIDFVKVGLYYEVQTLLLKHLLHLALVGLHVHVQVELADYFFHFHVTRLHLVYQADEGGDSG